MNESICKKIDELKGVIAQAQEELYKLVATGLEASVSKTKQNG